MMKTGIEVIAAERERQINEEGWTACHDDRYTLGQLAKAATCYLYKNDDGKPFWFWPFQMCWWKPTPDDRIKELAKAGALIAAEIDRLQRLQQSERT